MANLPLMAALHYAALGLPTCPINGKSPAYQGGHGWRDATANQDALELLFTQRDHSGVGIATGVHGWVLDVDGPHGLRSLRRLINQHGELPPGPVCHTGGGGFHVWFAWDDRCAAIKNSVGFAHGLDIRTSGGGVVAPPSVHPETKRYYTWRVGRSPYDLPFPAAPDWLIDAITSTYSTPAAPTITANAPVVVVEDRYAEAALRSAETRIATAPNGTQRMVLFKESRSIGKAVVGRRLCSHDEAFARLVTAGLRMTSHTAVKWTRPTVERVVSDGLTIGMGSAAHVA
jgi:hypothetical protein